MTLVRRDPRLLRAARDQECQWCGRNDGTTVAAHSNQQIHGKGMGIKAGDNFVAFLCGPCHQVVDQSPILSKDEKRAMWDIAHERTVEVLRRMGLA